MDRLLERFLLAQARRSLRAQVRKRGLIYILLVLGAALLGVAFGLTRDQVGSVTVFSVIVLGALLFWRFRLAFALLGLALLLVLGLTDVEHIVEFAGLDIILFLVGMMLVIGFLEERRFFERLVSAITEFVGPHALRLITVLMVLSALFSALVAEVTSILFMTATVLHLCGRYKVSPVPLLMMVVFATNIGSSATVVGNPVGVMVALRGELTFMDFLRWASPIATIALAVSIPILLIYFRRYVSELNEAMRQSDIHSNTGEPVLNTLFARELWLPWLILTGTILLLVLHTSLEKLLGLQKNSMLLGTAMAASGIALALERERARELVEERVEWWTLTFFILLFASVGTLTLTGVTEVLADYLVDSLGGNDLWLFAGFTWVAGIMSALMDNVLAVATFIPVVQDIGAAGIDAFPLWWGMLFGGTFFGNLTVIGSTANIVAIGMLERRGLGHISMGEWFRSMAIPSVVTLLIATCLIYVQLLR